MKENIKLVSPRKAMAMGKKNASGPKSRLVKVKHR